jgi:hypothetical protein
LDELEKQDGVLSATAVVRYLSSMRAIIDALPNHLFMMLAITPDALRRYSLALPAFRSRLENRIELQPLNELDEALNLASFYLNEALKQAEPEVAPKGRRPEPLVTKEQMRDVFSGLLERARRRGDDGVRQREFLHALHGLAEDRIQASASQ